MSNTWPLHRTLISLGLPFLILLFLVFLAQSPAFNRQADLGALALTLDFLITVPLIYYLLIRKSTIPPTTVVPVLILGITAGTYALPVENQYYLDLFKVWGLPMVEIFVFTYILFKIRAAVRKFRQQTDTTPDFFTAVKDTCSAIFPKKIVPFIATEMAVIYYGFMQWKKPATRENEFTYHKKSGTPALLITFICIIIIEATALHIWLARWSHTAAWICTGLSLYTAVQLYGFLRSFSRRPIVVDSHQLIVRCGILAETEIVLSEIDSIELSKRDLRAEPLAQKLSPFGDLESHNVIITLKKKQYISGLYGFRKPYLHLAFFLDEKEAFKQKVETALQQKSDLAA